MFLRKPSMLQGGVLEHKPRLSCLGSSKAFGGYGEGLASRLWGIKADAHPPSQPKETGMYHGVLWLLVSGCPLRGLARPHRRGYRSPYYHYSLGQVKGPPHSHLSPRSRVPTSGHRAPQPAAPTPVPHGDYTLGSPGPGKALGGVGWSGGLSWSLTFDPGHAGCL